MCSSVLWCTTPLQFRGNFGRLSTPANIWDNRRIVSWLAYGLAYVLVRGMAPGRAQMPLSPTTNSASQRSFRRCSSVGTSRSMVASPEFLEQPSADQQQAAHHQHPSGNVIVTHMLRSLTRSTATAAK